MLTDEYLVLLGTTKPLPIMNCKHHEKVIEKEKDHSHAEVTPHTPFGLTWYARDCSEKILDVGSWVRLVQPLILWVFNIIDVDDGRQRVLSTDRGQGSLGLLGLWCGIGRAIRSIRSRRRNDDDAVKRK